MFSTSSALNKLAARDGALAHARELAIILGAYFVYLAVRKLIGINFESVALDNAARLISFERDAGFFWESGWHQWAIDSGKWLVVLFNWIYIVTFFPIVLTVALIFYIVDRDKYFYYRSVILLSFAFALVIFMVFPLAPPRMMEGYGFVDTFKVFGPGWYAGREMATYYNAYAAMPSLHFAWTVIFGVLFFRQGGWHFRLLGILYPTMTLLAITVTANHYLLDAFVGGVMMALTYAVYEVVFTRSLFAKVNFASVRARIQAPAPFGKREISGRFRSPHSRTSS